MRCKRVCFATRAALFLLLRLASYSSVSLRTRSPTTPGFTSSRTANVRPTRDPVCAASVFSPLGPPRSHCQRFRWRPGYLVGPSSAVTGGRGDNSYCLSCNSPQWVITLGTLGASSHHGVQPRRMCIQATDCSARCTRLALARIQQTGTRSGMVRRTLPVVQVDRPCEMIIFNRRARPVFVCKVGEAGRGEKKMQRNDRDGDPDRVEGGGHRLTFCIVASLPHDHRVACRVASQFFNLTLCRPPASQPWKRPQYRAPATTAVDAGTTPVIALNEMDDGKGEDAEACGRRGDERTGM